MGMFPLSVVNDSFIPLTINQPALFRFSDTDTSAQMLLQSQSQTAKLFSEHSLQPVNPAPLPLLVRTPDWFTLVLVVVIIFLVWLRMFYFKILNQMISAFFSNSVSNQIVRDENILVQRASIMLSFIFYFIAALFVYQVSIHFNWDFPFLNEGFLRFIVISLLIAFAYSFKMILLKGLGELFRLDRPVATYIFNIFLINNILGLFLLPVVITVAYIVTDSTEMVIYTGIALVVMSFIYRLVRGFHIWTTLQGVSFFYLIIYFCTLEIAPLVIIIKLSWG